MNAFDFVMNRLFNLLQTQPPLTLISVHVFLYGVYPINVVSCVFLWIMPTSYYPPSVLENSRCCTRVAFQNAWCSHKSLKLSSYWVQRKLKWTFMSYSLTYIDINSDFLTRKWEGWGKMRRWRNLPTVCHSVKQRWDGCMDMRDGTKKRKQAY